MSRTYGKLTIDTKASTWKVEAEPNVALRLKRVFGSIARTKVGVLTVYDNPANARDLLWFLGRYPLEIDAGLRGYLVQRADAHDRSEAMVQRVLAGDFAAREIKLAKPLRRYQSAAVEMVLRTGRLLLGDVVGLGKTATAIGMIHDPAARPALVVTLAHLPPQWAKEVKQFAPDLSVMVPKRGTPTEKEKAELSSMLRPDVIVLNYHRLHGWADFLNGVVRSITFDEVQELRRGDLAEKGRAARLLARRCAFRLGLSATPVYNFGGEIYRILDVLEEGCLGSWEEFMTEWATARGDGHAVVTDPVAFGSMLRERGLFLRRTGADVRDEVPELKQPIKIPHLIEADAAVVEKAQTAAADLARILLSVGGRGEEKMRAAAEIDWRLRQATGIAKAPYVAAFVRMLVEGGDRVILFGWHHAVYRLYGEKLADLKPVFFTGDESIQQKLASKQAFLDGDARVLVMSLRAGAGIDGLQDVAKIAVFGELDWAPGVHDQCIGRLWRPGQKELVLAYFLHSDSGSDPVILDVLGMKAAQSRGIHDPRDPFVGTSVDGSSHVRKLAEDCLRRAGRPIPSQQRSA